MGHEQINKQINNKEEKEEVVFSDFEIRSEEVSDDYGQYVWVDEPEPKTTKTARVSPVPYEKIKTLFNEILGDTLGGVRLITTKRRTRMRSTYALIKRIGGETTEDGILGDFAAYFRAVREVDWMCGRKGDGRTVSFEYVCSEECFSKVYEGRK